MARPAEFDPKYVAHIRGTFPELRHRALRDRCYAISVFGILAPDAETIRFDWLTDASGKQRGGEPRWRIINELGRLYHHGHIDDAQVESLAADICQRKPRTADCVAWLQSLRGKAPAKFDAVAISASVAKTILDHCHRCDREVDRDLVDVLLTNIHDMLIDAEGEE